MSISFLEDAGPGLDRRIAKRVLGRRHSANPPHYSTEVDASEELLARLEREGVTATLEEDEGLWYCVFWAQRLGDGVKERIATGSAHTRPLAACRAVLNLPLTGSGTRLALRVAESGWIDEAAARSTTADPARSALHAVPEADEEAPWLIPDEPGVSRQVRGRSGR